MRFFLLAVLLIFSNRVQANLGFTYSETADYSKPKLIDILEVQTELEERGYWPVDLSHEQKLQGIGVDQMFFDASASKLVLLKFGQKLSDSSYIQKLISFEGDFLFHGETAGNVPFALFFIGHRELETRNVLQGLGVKKSVSLLQFLIPEARAACNPSALVAMGSLSMTTSSPLILQRLWNCGLTAGAEARDTVKGFAKSVKSFFKDPAKFWKGTKEAVKQLWGFVSKIHLEVGKLIKAIGGLDSETAWQVGCSIAGQLLPGIVAGALTGGAATIAIARALPMLTAQLQNIRSMSSILQTLSKQRQAGRLKNADSAIGQVVSCAR